MTCDTRNCVYVIECGRCYKYYIGETRNFRLRANLRPYKKEQGFRCQQTYISLYS